MYEIGKVRLSKLEISNHIFLTTNFLCILSRVKCSFDAIIKKYKLDKKNSDLLILAEIVRGAGTEKRQLTPQSIGLAAIGLAAIAAGFTVTSKDDYE
jgi:hypothetical protein